MKVDAELMFECLIYLNCFYYIVFCTCETIMTAAKYQSVVDTPNIGQDAIVTFTMLSCELGKIVLFQRFKEDRRNLVTGIAVVLTFVTVLGLLYTFFVQSPVLKLEYILGILSMMLALTEIAFGVLHILPCFKPVQYY